MVGDFTLLHYIYIKNGTYCNAIGEEGPIRPAVIVGKFPAGTVLKLALYKNSLTFIRGHI
jgi:hypothetical protein